jgi:hypothetical protein
MSFRIIDEVSKVFSNVMENVCPTDKPFGVVKAMVWSEGRPGAELDNVSLALVTDDASALRKSVGSPVLQRNTASPTVIATACRVRTVLAV